MGIDEAILRELIQHSPRRGGIPAGIILMPLLLLYKKKTVQNGIARLKEKQHIMFVGRSVFISSNGRQYIKERKVLLPNFSATYLKHGKKRLIVIFDIPEKQKAEREWFRKQLRNFGYEMIQRSVWFGPAPLPEDFIEYVKSIGLQNMVRVFESTPRELK